MATSPASPPAEADAISALYQTLLAGWNNRRADEMAALIAEDGNLIGFDGSPMNGRAEIQANLRQIFADHPTATYVGKIREIRFLTPHRCAPARRGRYAAPGSVPAEPGRQHPPDPGRRQIGRAMVDSAVSKYAGAVSRPAGVGPTTHRRIATTGLRRWRPIDKRRGTFEDVVGRSPAPIVAIARQLRRLIGGVPAVVVERKPARTSPCSFISSDSNQGRTVCPRPTSTS